MQRCISAFSGRPTPFLRRAGKNGLNFCGHCVDNFLVVLSVTDVSVVVEVSGERIPGPSTSVVPDAAHVPSTGADGLALTGGDIATLIVIALLLIAIGFAITSLKRPSPRPDGDPS